MHSILVIIFIVLVGFSFFFSLAETSIISLSKIKLRHLVANGVKGAKSLQRTMVKLDKLIVAILVGNNFVNITLSVLTSVVFIHAIGEKWGVPLSTIVTTLFVLILLEITPKVLAIKHTEKLALFSGPIMEWLMKIFSPVVSFFSWISNIILKILGIKQSARSPLITQEELKMMIEAGKEEGLLSDEERKMMQRIFDFGSAKVKDVMVSKERIIAVNQNSTAQELMNAFTDYGHSRLPVYQEQIDKIIGVIYARDLFYVLKDKNVFLVHDLIYPIVRVLADSKVSDLLKRFQRDKIQIAIIVDQNNRTLGLVTLEDLIEEIVGEIEEDPDAVI